MDWKKYFTRQTHDITAVIATITAREADCWRMAKVFLDNLDAHGLHDIGVEIEGLRRARAEVEKLAS